MRQVCPIVLAAMFLSAGCGDDAADISSANYLMRMQHQAWENARKSLATDEPNLTILHGIDVFLSQRTPRRLEKEYHGEDRQAILDKLADLSGKYARTIMTRLDVTRPEVRLRPGATLGQVRDAFKAVDVEYLQLQELAAGKVG